jgi:hypothetical protein
MLSHGFTLSVSGLEIRVHDYIRPLAIGTLCAAGLLIVGSASRRWRGTAIGLLAACGALALVACARQAAPKVPEGDMALLESYTMFAADWNLFVGPYSRFSWNHPGPLYFYLLVPFHTLSGRLSVGLWAGALALNLTALGAMFWIALRMNATRLAVTLSAAWALYLWRVGEVLTSPWNPHVLVLPLAVLVLLSAAVVAGATALWPLVALTASFVAQTHVGLVPTAAAVVGIAALASAWQGSGGGAGDRTRLWRPVHGAAWLLLLLWFLPLAEEAHARTGNLTHLWRFFFVERRVGQTFALAFTAWAEQLSGLLHPWLGVGWGSVYVAHNSVLLSAVAVAQVALLPVAAIAHRRSGRVFQSALAALLLVASVVACWSVTRIEDELMDHAIFWISGLGVMNVAVLLDAGLGTLPLAGRLTVRAAAAGGALVWGIAALLGVQLLQERAARAADPTPEERRAHYFASEVVAYLRQHPGVKPLIRIDQDAWHLAAGATVQLRKENLPFAVESAWLSMFGEAVAPQGDENAVIVFATEQRHDAIMRRPGRTLLAEWRGLFVVVDPAGELLRD